MFTSTESILQLLLVAIVFVAAHGEPGAQLSEAAPAIHGAGEGLQGDVESTEPRVHARRGAEI